ncbi:MAG: arginine deiminase-related protein [Lysobacteraceae bacterium]
MSVGGVFTDLAEFLAVAQRLPAERPAVATAAFLVRPDGIRLAEQSALDNAYMDTALRIDAARAVAQHARLHSALSGVLPTLLFPGNEDTPDAVFPNNVFATARLPGESQGRFLIGRMRHPVRQREAERADIAGFFSAALGYRCLDLRQRPGLSELTGTVVIDRARGIGLAGLGPRCDLDGVRAMHEAFGLRATLAFDLAPDEYHANVVLSVLAGRTLVIGPSAFVAPAVPEGLLRLYGQHGIVLDPGELRTFAGNCIALDPTTVWMSEAAADGLAAHNRTAFATEGWRIAAVALDEIEKAGGSLRCCVAEVF